MKNKSTNFRFREKILATMFMSTHKEIEAQVLSAVSVLVEECIGEDEVSSPPTSNEYDDQNTWARESNRNQLRAEIRERFKEALK